MRILFLLNIGFDRVGPSVHLLQDVIRDSLNRGHCADVILKDTGGELEKIPSDFIDNNLFNCTLIESPTKGKNGFVVRYLEELLYALKCKKKYRKNKYDVVFLQSCNAAVFYMLGLKKLKCPVVFNVQDIFPQNLMFSGQLPMSKITFPLFSYLQRAAYKKATRIITISGNMKKTLNGCGINPYKIDVVYNWSYSDDPIVLSEIPDDHVFDLNKDKNKINVVYAGNIGKMQNVELIARTAVLSRGDNSIHYYIIGDGANKRKIEDIVDGVENVTVLPMQPSKFAESIYAQADINVIPLARGGINTALPSKTATVLRADSYAVFCIDAKSDFEETVKGFSKIRVVDNSDPQALYQMICELRDNPKQKNVCDASDFSLFSIKNASRYVDILESAAEQKK